MPKRRAPGASSSAAGKAKAKGKEKERGEPYLDKDGKTWLRPDGTPYRPDEIYYVKTTDVELPFHLTEEQEENMTQEEMTKLYHEYKNKQDIPKDTDNKDEEKVALMTEEGDLVEPLVDILIKTFLRFAQNAKKHVEVQMRTLGSSYKFDQTKLYWTEDELDEFSKTVNNDSKGLDQAAKDEIKEHLDVNEDGNLTVSAEVSWKYAQV